MASYMTDDRCEQVINNAARFGYDYMRQWGLHHTVTGYSGGADSLLVACISMIMAEMAKADGYPLVNFGSTMPIDSTAASLELGHLTAYVTGAVLIENDLTDVFRFAMGTLDWHEYFGVDPQSDEGQMLGDIVAGRMGQMEMLDEDIRQALETMPSGEQALKAWEWTGKIAQGNLRARIRMAFGLYHIAMRVGGLVMSTDNLSEYFLSFWTKHGDVGDLGLIQLMFKGSEVYDLLRWFNKYRFDRRITPIIEAEPDDGLGIANGDADQIGAEYPDSDIITRSLMHDGFEVDGEMAQLLSLPSVDGYPDELVLAIAERTLKGKPKRADVIVPTRAQLGLPEIMDVPVR